MKQLTIREARRSLSHLDRLLAAEKEVMITRRGQAVARLVQVGKERAIPSHKNLRKRMPLMRKASEKLIREDRNSQ